MLNNYRGISSKATSAQKTEDESSERAPSRGRQADLSHEDISDYVLCLRCSQLDQTQGLDRINCLCSLSNQIGHFRSEPNRGQHLNKSMRLENPGQLYNFINKCRKWIKVWNPKNLAEPNAEFSLTTYNILSQNLLLNHIYLYQGNTKSDLMWSERGERLKQELIELNSDIFCLQEVHLENFKATILPSLLELGYQAVFKQKTGEHLDGCSILFKKNKFRLQDSLEVEFNRLDISHLLDKDNVALVVKLRPIGLHKEVDTNLIVANTHLLFNPKRGDIKISQLRLLFAEIQRFALTEKLTANLVDPFKMNYSPVIFCGDMNSEPSSPLVKFIENGKQNLSGLKSGDISGQREGIERGRFMVKQDLQIKGINWDSCFDQQIEDQQVCNPQDMVIRHVFNLKSVYPTVDEFSKRLISMATYYDSGLVDHIFYSYRHKNLRLSAFRQLLNRRNISSIGHLPNSILGSDHIALSAKFFIL